MALAMTAMSATSYIDYDQSSYIGIGVGGIFLDITEFVWIFVFGAEEGTLCYALMGYTNARISTSNSHLNHHSEKTRVSMNNMSAFPSNPAAAPIAAETAVRMENSPNETNGKAPAVPEMNDTSINIPDPNATEYVYKVKALYAYNPTEAEELPLAQGEILEVVNNKGSWWQARNSSGKVGMIPSNYLEVI